jgi:hypothetical protein
MKKWTEALKGTFHSIFHPRAAYISGTVSGVT